MEFQENQKENCINVYLQINLMDPRPYHFEYRKPRVSNPTYQSGRLYESIYHIGSFSKAFPNMEKIQNRPAYQLPSLNRNTERQQSLDNMINKRIQQIDPQYEKMISQRHNGMKNSYPQNKQRQEYGPSGMERSFHNQINRNQPERNQKSIEYPDRNRNQFSQAPENNSNPRNYEQKERSIQPRSYSQDVSTLNKNSYYNEPGYMSNYGNRLMRPMPGKDQDRIYQNQQKPYNIISFYPSDAPVHRKFPKLTLENKLIETGQYFGQQPNLNYNPQKY